MNKEFFSDEELYANIRDTKIYKHVFDLLSGLAEDGDEDAQDTLRIINSLIPPENPDA